MDEERDEGAEWGEKRAAKGRYMEVMYRQTLGEDVGSKSPPKKEKTWNQTKQNSSLNVCHSAVCPDKKGRKCS